jgi:hypothetical protein
MRDDGRVPAQRTERRKLLNDNELQQGSRTVSLRATQGRAYSTPATLPESGQAHFSVQVCAGYSQQNAED